MAPQKTPARVGRVYRVTWWWRALAVFFLAFSSLGGIKGLTKVVSGNEEPALGNVAVFLLLVIVGIYLVALAFKATVGLSDDAIEFRSLFSRKRLFFSQIRGRRQYAVDGGEDGGTTRYMKLEPNDDRLPPLSIPKDTFAFDAVFHDWFNKLPDLDAMDKLKPKSSNFGLT
jgi:hypothetical protein